MEKEEILNHKIPARLRVDPNKEIAPCVRQGNK